MEIETAFLKREIEERRNMQLIEIFTWMQASDEYKNLNYINKYAINTS